MSNSFEYFRKHWIWPVLVSAITLAITIYSAHLQYRSARHEMGGSLMATFYKHSLNNREARTIVVCMEDANVNLRGLYVTPTFDNPSEFSIKDFSLTFNVQCSNVTPVPSSFVEAHSFGGDEWLFRYKDDLLAAHDDTKRIFTDYNVTGNTGHCFIETKASYDGASAAFEYNTDVWFLVVPKKHAQSYEDWKINCKKRIFDVISDRYYDVYYFSHDKAAEYQFDVALTNDHEAAPSPSAQPAPKPAPQKVVETKPAPTPAPKPTPKPVEVKPTPTPAAPKKVEQSTTPVVVPPVNTAQEINLAKYSSTKYYDRFTIHFELDKTPAVSGKYLLYGHYTISGKDTPFTIARSIDIDNRIKRYSSSRRTIDSLEYHLNDLRIIEEADKDGLISIEMDKSNNRRMIKNISENKLVVIVYSTYAYQINELEKSETYYDMKGNDGKILVFDTGEKSTKQVKADEKGEEEKSVIEIIASVIYFLLAVLGCAMVILFIVIVNEEKGIAAACNVLIRDYNEESIYIKIFGIIAMISPVITIIFAIRLIF